MAEAIRSATVGVVDTIAAVTTGIADKLGGTTPSSQTSLVPPPPAATAEHTNPPRPEHLPPGGALPVAHPPPLSPGAQATVAGGTVTTPVGAGAAVAQPVASVSVEDGAAAAASDPTAPASAPLPTTVASAVATDGRRMVRFRWVMATTSSVVVKGSWDGWTGEVDCAGEGGEVALLPGTYTWKYIIDGEYVCGKGSDVVVDAEGNSNHVLTVE